MALSKFYAFDAATGLLHRDVGLAALTADGYVGPAMDQGGAALTDFITILNVESCKVSAGDEAYTFRVVVGNASDKSDSRVVATVVLGDAAAKPQDTVDDVAGDRIEIRWRSEINGIAFRYMWLYLDVNGTSPSIGFNAFTTAEA